MKERKIVLDDVEYTLTLSKGNVLRINGRIFRGSEFGNEIDKKVNEYNFKFAPEMLELKMDITISYGDDMNPKFKDRYLELLDVAIETNTPISPNNIEEIEDEFIPLEEDGEPLDY
tara:strand:- start:53 stop:400 length:348 start_codon:yes stop_codon:yes gene_type:complete